MLSIEDSEKSVAPVVRARAGHDLEALVAQPCGQVVVGRLPNAMLDGPLRAVSVEHDEVDVPVRHRRRRDGASRLGPALVAVGGDPVRLVGHDR